MKKTVFYLILAFATLCVSSCHQEDELPKTSFGECSYHPSFLWTDADTCGVTKRLYLDFNDDAKGDECYAEIAFVDKDSNPIPNDILEITVDGVIAKGNIIKVCSRDTMKEVKFRFLPKAESGNHQGYIKLDSYNLNRFEDTELNGSPIEVMRWDLSFDKRMNPLAKVIMWIGILIITSLLIWFLFLKQFLFPRIKLSRLELSSKKGYYVNKRINGVRKVVLSNKREKQSFLNKLFTGKILYIVNEVWTSPWELSPKGRRRAAKINLHGKYMISPVTSEIANYGTYQLDNLTTKESITIKIL